MERREGLRYLYSESVTHGLISQASMPTRAKSAASSAPFQRRSKFPPVAVNVVLWARYAAPRLLTTAPEGSLLDENTGSRFNATLQSNSSINAKVACGCLIRPKAVTII